MPLYDFHCSACGNCFETIVSSSDIRSVECAKCGEEKTERLVPRFRIGGRGDLRESTFFHGCHENFTGLADPTHSHTHGTDDAT